MEKILTEIFDKKTISIIKEILSNNKSYIREISRKTKIPVATVYRIFKKLEKAGLLKKKKFDIYSFYEVNKNSKAYSFLSKIFGKTPSPLQILINELEDKVEEIHLLNKEENKASVMVIGNVALSKIQKICNKIKEDTGFSIRAIAFTKEQIENLEALNMKPKSKEVLFKIRG